MFNDAWASAAQVISFPPMEMNMWDISPPTRDTMEAELRRCNGVVLQMDLEFVRALPKVGRARWREA